MRVKLMYIFTVIFVAFGGLLMGMSSKVEAFSGSDITNYYCLTIDGVTPDPTESLGGYICIYEPTDGGSRFTRNAVPRPPQLSIIQYWFVRILYLLWGFAGVVFALVLIGIGLQYMTSFGNEFQLSDVIKKFRKWLIGLFLVFFSYPILATFFAILPIAQTPCYENISMPGFQFFFPNACISVDCDDPATRHKALLTNDQLVIAYCGYSQSSTGPVLTP